MVARKLARPPDVVVTPRDVDLLSALDATGSIVEACARIGLTRDTGMYRLRRLARAIPGPVVVSVRGGAERGGTRLTESGRRLLRQGVGALQTSRRSGAFRGVNRFRGTWRSSPQPHVLVGGDVALFVTFAAREGEMVRIAVEPEAIVVARSRFETSARNVLRGTVQAVRRWDAMRSILRVRIARATWFDVAVTPRSLRLLGVKPGARVFLYLKATAVTRLD